MHPRMSVALAVLTAVLLAAAAVAGYARYELSDRDEFSARAVSALDDDDVRSVVAEQLVNALASGVSADVLTVRPLLTPAISALADTAAFRRVLARALRDQHQALFYGGARVPLNLEYAGGLLRESLRSVSPRIARAIPPGSEPQLAELDDGDVRLVTARKLTNLADWWWPLLAATFVSALGCALLAGGWRTALAYLGAAITAAGLTVAVLVTIAGATVGAHVAESDDERLRNAVHGIWAALFDDLRSAGLIAAVAGLIVAGLASRRPAVALVWLRQLARSPAREARIARGVVLLLLGAAAIVEPGLVVRGAAVAGGLLLLLLGVAELRGRARGVLTSAGESAPAAAAEHDAATPPPAVQAPAAAESSAAVEPSTAKPLLLVGIVVGVLAVTVIALALVLPAPRVAPAAVAGPVGGCNGSTALCDRRLNEVAFASTHNSYAASDEPGWLFPNQRFGIERQLRDGIRGFLIDVHYGVRDPETGLVRTDLDAEGSSRNKVAKQLSPRALRTADRLAGRAGVGQGEGRPRPYLCHTLCELGSEPLDEQLELFRRFLDANPGEVVVLFVEPYVPVGEFERALERTDLLGEAAELQRDEPLPTLGQLIRARTRLVILSEEDGGSRAWYLPGFSFAQDTPLGATRPSEFSCARYRGSADSPLFLLNHWIDTFPPSPSRNTRAGGSVLRERLRRCQRERQLTPNLIAVDFYERIGVVRIADQRNRRP